MKDKQESNTVILASKLKFAQAMALQTALKSETTTFLFSSLNGWQVHSLKPTSPAHKTRIEQIVSSYLKQEVQAA